MMATRSPSSTEKSIPSNILRPLAKVSERDFTRKAQSLTFGPRVLTSAGEASLASAGTVPPTSPPELELPEPVHLHLAHALRADGREDEARAVLAGYLEQHPEGRWADDTRAALDG